MRVVIITEAGPVEVSEGPLVEEAKRYLAAVTAAACAGGVESAPTGKRRGRPPGSKNAPAQSATTDGNGEAQDVANQQ
jgi:hypothetical protein